MCRYDGREFTSYIEKGKLAYHDVRSMLQDRDGNLWFGTDGGGVSRFDGKTWTTFTVADGLTTNEAQVIFMTALSETEDKVRGFEAGGVDYVTKPIQQEEVLARVTTHLTLHRLKVRLEEAVAERTVELRVALEEVERLKDRL